MKQRYIPLMAGAVVLSVVGLAGCGANTTTATNSTVAQGNSATGNSTSGTGNTASSNSTNATQPAASNSTGSSNQAQAYIVNLHEVSNGTVWVFNTQTDPSNMPYTVYFSSYKTATPSTKLKPSTSTKLIAIPPTQKENGVNMSVSFGSFYTGPQNWVLFTTSVAPQGAAQSYINYLYAVNPSTQVSEKVTSFKVGGGAHFGFAVKNNDIYYKETSPGTGGALQTKYGQFNVQTKSSSSLSSSPSVTWTSLG